jgi:hypothetical protein
MPRQRAEDLDAPAPEHNPALAPPHPVTGSCFERKIHAREEDRFRALLVASMAESDLIDSCRARSLARRLIRAAHGGPLPGSLASATNMRQLRINLTGALHDLHDRYPLQTFTLIPHGWSIPAAELDSFDPIKRLAALRSLLNRAGAGDAQGFLIGFLHGELEPESQVYQLHLHGAVHGEMVDVLDNLREGLNRSDEIMRRLRISRQRLCHLPHPLTYVLQSYWPCRRIGPVGEEGEINRNRQKQRIPEPFHTQYLLWLDRHRLGDLNLMIGLSVVGGRLQPRD